MINTQQTQSLTDFRQKASQTLERLNRTDEAEILTVNGQAKAVLMSPIAYDALARAAQMSADVTTMRTAVTQIADGKTMEAGQFFDGLHKELLARKRKPRRQGRTG